MGHLINDGNFLEANGVVQNYSQDLEELQAFSTSIMGTSGGEPRLLLNALKPMLGIDGDIKTPQEVLRVVGLMKDAEKLMSRCIYLNILRATCSQSKSNGIKKDTLERFLTSGGWGILNKWLNEYTKNENTPVLLEIIEVLKCLPVTIGVLKQGNTGKVVKQLTKFEDTDVRKGAMQLIKQWKGMIRGGNNSEKAGKSSPRDSKDTIEKGQESLLAAIKRQRQGSSDEKFPPEKKAKQTDEKQSKGKSPDGKPVAMESFGFMNAMAAVTSKPVKKKKKPSVTKTTLPLDEILNNKGPNGDKNTEPPYASPMREDQDKVKVDSEAPANENNAKLKDDVKDTNGDTNDSQESESLQPPTKKAKTGKRSITWADDDNLIKVCYFELDEEELASMHHTVNFMTAKQNELIREREALETARRMGEDRMVEKTMWKRPSLIEMNPLPIEAGEKSREKYIQKEREQKVLADIFLTKASLPDSPAEPENESEDHGLAEPKLIPHDEDGTLYPKPSIPVQQTGQPSAAAGNNQSTDDSKAKEPKGSSSGSLLGDPTAEMLASVQNPDMPPAVHNIMKHIMVNKPGSPQDFPRPGGPEFMGRGGRPMGPEAPGGPGFPPGHPRFPIRGGVPRPLINVYQGRPRGGFRGRPMPHRGRQMRPRFHGPRMGGMPGGNEENYELSGGDEGFRGRGRGRGGPPLRGRGKREPPLCRHFMSPGGCRNGQNCNFLHPMTNGPPN